MGGKSSKSEVDSGLELILAKSNLGLSQSSPDKYYSLLICILQEVSGKPWVNIEMEEEKFLDFTTEWDLLTHQIATVNLQFLCEIRQLDCEQKGGRLGQRHYIELLNIFAKFYQIPFRVCVLSRAKFQDGIEPIPDYEMNSTLPVRDGDTYKTIRLIESSENTPSIHLGFFRLITSTTQLYPNPFSLATEYIDQLSRFHILKDLFVLKYPTDARKTENSSDFKNLQKDSESFAKCGTFSEIFQLLLPDDPGELFFMRKHLLDVEPRLTSNEKIELRIEFIHIITAEMYYPIRCSILAEKESFEQKCEWAAERQARLKIENGRLNELMQTSKESLVLLEKELLESQSQFTKTNEAIRERQLDLTQLSEAIAKQRATLLLLEEKQAFNLFLDQLQFLKGDFKILEQMLKLSEEHWDQCSLSVLTRRRLDILQVGPWPPHLQSHVEKGSLSDKGRIVEAVNGILEIPIVKTDGAGKLCAKGNHIILSNITSQIHSKLAADPNITELQIVARGNLIINEDVRCKGINVVMIGRNVVVQMKVNVDVSGTDGADPQELKAKNGDNDGNHGNNGDGGVSGGNGGDVHIEGIETLVNPTLLVINSAGGSGGKGQHGGDGKNGRPGTDGKNMTVNENPEPSWFTSYKWGGKFSYIKCGTLGTPGCYGGFGGRGGLGGEGGRGGKFILIHSGRTAAEKTFENGKPGNNGDKGRDGENGKHGRHGMDHGWGKAGIWEKSVATQGYGLTPDEIRNLTFNGQRIVSGREPTYPGLRERTNEIHQSKQERAKTQQKKQINRDEIKGLGKTIGVQPVSSGEDQAKLDVQKIIEKEVSKSNAEENSTRRLVAEANRQKSLVRQRENESNKKHEEIFKMQNKINKFGDELQKAEEEETISKARAAECEHLSLVLENQHKESIQATNTAQTRRRAMAQQTKNVVYKSVDEPEEYGSRAYAKPSLRTSQSFDYSYDSDVDFLADFPTLQDHPEVLIDVEASVQIVRSTLGKIPDSFGEFLRNLEHIFESDDKYLQLSCAEYLAKQLVEDVLVSEQTGRHESVEELVRKYRKENLFELILSLRRREIPNFNKGHLEFPPTLKKILEEIELTETFLEILEDWQNEKEEETRFQKLKSKLYSSDRGISKMTKVVYNEMKAKILKKAWVCYDEIQPVLLLDFKTFLKDFISFIKTRPELDFDERDFLSGRIQNFDQKTVLSKTEDFFTDPTISLSHVTLIISKLHMKIEDFEGIQQTIGRIMKNVPTLASNRLEELLHFQKALAKMYKTSFQETLMNEVKKRCSGKGNSRMEFLEYAGKFETMIESVHYNLNFVHRTQSYTALIEEIEKTENIRPYFQREFARMMGEMGTKYLSDSHVPNFSKFSLQLENYLTGFPNESSRQYYSFYLENVECTLQDLAELEGILRKVLTVQNYAVALNFQQIIEDKLLSFEKDLINLQEKYDVDKCQNISREILAFLLKFIPTNENVEESRITDPVIIKNYFEFSLLRIEVMLIGKCDQMCSLKDLIFGIVGTPKDYLKALDSFYAQLCTPASKKNLKDLLEFMLENLQETESLYLEILQFVTLGDEMVDHMVTPATIRNLKRKLDTRRFQKKEGEDQVAINCNGIRSVINCIFDNKEFPKKDLRGKLSRASTQFKKFKSLLDKIQLKTKEMSSYFTAATYTQQIQKGLEGIKTLDDTEKFAFAQLTTAFVNSDSLKPETPMQKSIKTSILKIMSGRKFPYESELDLILETISKNSQAEIKYEMLQGYYQITEIDLEQETKWTTYAKKLLTAMPQSNDASHQIVLLMLNSNDESFKQLLRRFLVQIKLRSKEEISTFFEFSRHESQARFFQELGMETMSKYLLVEEESKFLEFYYKSPTQKLCPELVKDFESVLSRQSPETWKSSFEKILFDALLEKLLAGISNELRRESLTKAVKSSYFIVGEKNRLTWLDLLYARLAETKLTKIRFSYADFSMYSFLDRICHLQLFKKS